MNRISAIFTGNELLNGSTADLNCAALGKALTAHGLVLWQSCCVPDLPAAIHYALGSVLETADIVILGGGLGSTEDDVTLKAAARFFGLELTENAEVRDGLQKFWAERHRGPCPARLLRQALVPAGAEILPNHLGSAPGLAFSALYDRKVRHLFLLPGPPAEFQALLQKSVLPKLAELTPERRVSLGFFAPGVGEMKLSALARKLAIPNGLQLSYTSSIAGCRCDASGADAATVRETLERLRRELPAPLEVGQTDLAAAVLAALQKRQWLLSGAESCTGGMIFSRLTDVPGASAVLAGGAVTYSNDLKHRLLGVPTETLAQYGAVSAETAAAMAAGAAEKFQTDCAYATTGIAGPDGGTERKPVGLVYLGIASPRGVRTLELRLHGDRAAIRRAARDYTLLELYRELTEESC